MKFLVATHNQGKLRELRDLLAQFPTLEIVGLGDVGVTQDIEETGTTFTENAVLKAQGYAALTGLLTLSDDSGLAVHALAGRPGVYSARYGGAGLDDAGRRAVLLNEMQTVTERSAEFVCVIALHDPRTAQTYTVEGRVQGQILHEERSAGYGFGYDPLFVPDGHELTFAQMPPAAKKLLSHRGRAVAQVPPILVRLMATG
jgi:XTP/dITP diphosphohydrolase